MEEVHKTHIADEATSAPRLRPVTVAEVMRYRNAGCRHCWGRGYHMRRERPDQKDPAITACGCAQRRFGKRHRDDIEITPEGLVFWKPGRSAPAVVAL